MEFLSLNVGYELLLLLSQSNVSYEREDKI